MCFHTFGLLTVCVNRLEKVCVHVVAADGRQMLIKMTDNYSLVWSLPAAVAGVFTVI